MDDAAIRRALVRQFEDGRDLDETHELYHDDAVLEFPQSGERFVGKASFLTWRKRYPARVDYRLRQDHGPRRPVDRRAARELRRIAADFGVSFVQFRGDRIARETIYVMTGSRIRGANRVGDASIRSASVSPSEWREGVPFGSTRSRAERTAPAS